MSKGTQSTKSNRDDPWKPLVSAADINEANYPRVRFDDDIAWTIKQTAQQRAPTPESVWRHQVGFAGELATSAYFGVPADWTIYDDYIGDDGYDIVVDEARVEVKAVTKRDGLELRVPVDRVEDADYFVLTRCSTSKELVQLMGYISRPEFKRFGHRFNGKLCVEMDCLHIFEPLFIPPERIRATQANR
jgi:hypothetical protein